MRVPAALLTLCLAPLARGLEGHSRVFTQGEMAGLLRRVSENNDLRGQRLARFVPFLVDGRTIGYVQRGFCVDRLAPFSNVFSLQGDEGNESAGLSLHFAPLVEAGDCQLRTDALAEVTASLRSDGLVPGWRDELVAAVSAFGLAPAFTVERAFYPSLGIRGFGVHVNGFVRDPVRKSVTQLWVARRSRSKSTWPGMLDHLVAGGVAAGVGLVDTVLRECAEEASIPAHIALQAVPVGAVSYSNVDAQGNLKRDVLFCYDLEMPLDFIPIPRDGEVESFDLRDVSWAVQRVVKGGEDGYKPNCNLVVADFLVRHGFISPESDGYLQLVRGLHQHD